MSKHGKYIYAPVAANAPENAGRPIGSRITHRAVLAEQSRYGADKLRQLRAQRGVGPAVRLTFRVVLCKVHKVKIVVGKCPACAAEAANNAKEAPDGQ